MYASAYVWAKIIGYLEERMTPVVVSTTFDDTEVVEFNDEALILFSPSEYHRGNIRTRFAGHIQDALKDLFGSSAQLMVMDETQLQQYRGQNSQRSIAGINRQTLFFLLTRYYKTFPFSISMVFPNFVNWPGSQQVINTCPSVI